MRDFTYRATLHVSKFNLNFEGATPHSNYITATLFYSYNNDATRFDNQYLHGALSLIRAVNIHLPTWRVMLFITLSAYKRAGDLLRILPTASICIVSDNQFESIDSSSPGWYLPTTYRYLPLLQPDSFDFVKLFAAVDLDVCFNEIYASLLQTWSSEDKSLFYVQWLEDHKHFGKSPYKRQWHFESTKYPIIPLGGGVAFNTRLDPRTLTNVWAHMNSHPGHGIDERVLQIIFNSKSQDETFVYTTYDTGFSWSHRNGFHGVAEDIMNRSGLEIKGVSGRDYHVAVDLIIDTLRHKLKNNEYSYMDIHGVKEIEFHDATNTNYFEVSKHDELEPHDVFGIKQLLFCPVFQIVIKNMKVPPPGFLEKDAQDFIDDKMNESTFKLSDKFIERLKKKTKRSQAQRLISYIEDIDTLILRRRHKIDKKVLTQIFTDIDDVDDYVLVQLAFLQQVNRGDKLFSLDEVEASIPLITRDVRRS